MEQSDLLGKLGTNNMFQLVQVTYLETKYVGPTYEREDFVLRKSDSEKASVVMVNNVLGYKPRVSSCGQHF